MFLKIELTTCITCTCNINQKSAKCKHFPYFNVLCQPINLAIVTFDPVIELLYLLYLMNRWTESCSYNLYIEICQWIVYTAAIYLSLFTNGRLKTIFACKGFESASLLKGSRKRIGLKTLGQWRWLKTNPRRWIQTSKYVSM